MVRTNNASKNTFILYFGVLHAVFAHVRAIGAFINGLGLEKAKYVAGWFDSSVVMRKIIERIHMKRPVATHEQSSLAIQYLPLKELTELGDLYATEDITNYIETVNRALDFF